MRLPCSDKAQQMDSEHLLEIAWAALLAASRMSREGQTGDEAATFSLDRDGALQPVAADAPEALLSWRPSEGWLAARKFPAAVDELLRLYLPLCRACADYPVTLGHLGQSLDGYIATSMGDSCYVTGPENIAHLHRMRALCDAVIVGAETVAADNPRLTTRLVPGSNPLRVVLDPKRRLKSDHGVFTDGQAPTLLISSASIDTAQPSYVGQAQVAEIPAPGGQLALDELLATLHERGCYAVFIEGGGTTVSGFLQAKLLDRLQIAVAPLLIGAGRPGVQLSASPRLRDCLRPEHRIYRMGGDVLYDFDLRAERKHDRASGATGPGLSRIL